VRSREYVKRTIVSALCAVLVGFTGCGGSSVTPNSPPPPPSVGKLYVTNFSTNSILRFKAGSNGDAAPEARFTLTNGPGHLAVDVPHDRLVASAAAQSLVILDNASSTPTTRVISGAATTMTGPVHVLLDPGRDLLYVLDSSILVFGPVSTISGNVAPLHSITISDSLPASGSIMAIILDAANDRLFALNDTNQSIEVFDRASTLNGVIVPDRIITGPATQVHRHMEAAALDSSGRLLVVCVDPSTMVTTLLFFPNVGSINGNVAPAGATTFPGATEMAVSPSGELYRVDVAPQLDVYNIATITGATIAVRTITGPHTGLDSSSPTTLPFVTGVALDPTR
jgi:hypothetical protein